MHKIGLALVLFIIIVDTLSAQTTEQQGIEDADLKQPSSYDATTTNERAKELKRFSIFKPSFVMWSIPDKRRDEQGLQIRLSAKYDFLTCSNTRDQGNVVSQGTCALLNYKALQNTIGTFSVFFSYTTDFDFYIFSDGDKELERDSRPVRNRTNSPALHLNWRSESSVKKSGFRYNAATLSLVHHSNGQDLDFDTLFTPESTDEEIRDTIANLASNNPSWTDGVSRGWNYIGLSAKFHIGRDVMNCKSTIFCTQISTGIKIPVFTDPSNKIWWEPGNNSDFRDYNVGSISFLNEWGNPAEIDPQFFSTGKKELSVEFKCGNRACSTAAALRLDLNLGEGNFLLPLMIYGHFGKNEHIYNYHEKSNMLGIGLRFTS